MPEKVIYKHKLFNCLQASSRKVLAKEETLLVRRSFSEGGNLACPPKL